MEVRSLNKLNSYKEKGLVYDYEIFNLKQVKNGLEVKFFMVKLEQKIYEFFKISFKNLFLIKIKINFFIIFILSKDIYLLEGYLLLLF